MIETFDKKTSKNSIEQSIETLNELLDNKISGEKIPSVKEQLRDL
jgi:hypothetical protein